MRIALHTAPAPLRDGDYQGLTRFMGREREMAAVKRLLAASHLLTLTGSGGCRETRLALQAGARLTATTTKGKLPVAWAERHTRPEAALQRRRWAGGSFAVF